MHNAFFTALSKAEKAFPKSDSFFFRRNALTAALRLDLTLLFARFLTLSCLNFFKAEVVIGILNTIVPSFQIKSLPLYLASSMVSTLIKNGRNLILRKQGSILSAATVIMVAYGFSSLLGLVRNRLFSPVIFVNHKSLLDAYFAAFVLPGYHFSTFDPGRPIGGIHSGFHWSPKKRQGRSMAYSQFCRQRDFTFIFGNISRIIYFCQPGKQNFSPEFQP